MPAFSWQEVYRRRAALAEQICKDIGLGFRLDVKETFHAYELTAQNIADQPMWRVPFYVVARRMMEASDHSHVIDHAWWLMADDRSGEPWGFVTEPYMEPTTAEKLAATLAHQHEEWGVTVAAWPAEQSPWYPGTTVPIVTTASVGMLDSFLRCGVAAALEHIGGRPRPDAAE